MRLAVALLLMIGLGWHAVSERADAVEVMAATGRPFGVGRIALPMTGPEEGLVLDTNGYRIRDEQGRLFYPAVVHRRVLGLIRGLLGVESADTPSTVNVYFLFRGDEPLRITFWNPQPQTVEVVPQRAPRVHARLLQAWWQNYNARGRLQEIQGDYPPLLETYLPRMLGQRFGLAAPRFNRPHVREEYQPEDTLKLVMNTEPARIRIMERTLAGTARDDRAVRPMPADIPWKPRAAPDMPAASSPGTSPPTEPTLEPMAAHVPEECFYIRFGSFENYLWLRKLLENNGGSVGRMVALRGHDAQTSTRAQDQLGLKESRLAEVLGGKIISDVAMIGRDTYLREGAAIGILFEARNNLLAGDLMKQRREAVARFASAGASMTKIQLEGHEVSVASTPDNRLRSLYVADGNYHLVSNSLAIVERFLESSSGQRTLAQSPDFRAARSRHPVSTNATVFAYLSPAFFRGLVSPQYQIELRRRLRSVTDLELVQMARWAARQEGLPHATIQDLVRSQMLPLDFEQRPDGSRMVEQRNGKPLSEPIDSLRGARGTFLPIPDVPLEQVTVEEEADYATIAAFHERKWNQMDPVLLQVTRSQVDSSGRERLEVTAEVDPFDRKKYGVMAGLVGPPTRRKIRQSPDDAITAQAVLQGAGRFAPTAGAHHVFFGIQNREVPVVFSRQSMFRILQVLRTAPAYLGAWPRMGLLDLLPLGEPPAVDARGLSELPFGLWRLQTEQGFALIGVNPDVLTDAGSQLAVEDAPQDASSDPSDDAQLRVHVMDISKSRIQSWFAALDFQRAYDTSIGNTRLLNGLTQQLGVPPAEALQVAESILGVRLVCALGGQYELRDASAARPYWVSTHWPEIREKQGETKAFASPSTAWFRGLDARLTMRESRIEAKATLEIQQTATEKPPLQFFDLFRRAKP